MLKLAPPSRALLLILFFSTWAQLGLPSRAVQAAHPAPFSAEYVVFAKGMRLGIGTITLTESDGEHYSIELNARAEGLARLIVADQIEERAHGIFDNNGPLPLHYRYSQTGGKEDRLAELRFDWDQSVVVFTANEDKQERLELSGRTVDPLSLYVQVMWDSLNDTIAEHYSIVSRGKLRDYTAEYDGKERIETGLGPVVTDRYRQTSKKGTRITTLWLSRSHQFLPARVVQTRRGKEQLRLELDSLD